MRLSAHAKINLFLDITSRRSDGFHNIISFMQTVSLSDTVTIEQAESGIELKGNYSDYGKKDLAYRAAEAFFDCFGISAGVKIGIEKRIPMQGGLAGGSADAAAVIRGLSRIYNVESETEKLLKLASSLGSDVPFCLVGGSRIAYGRGEILKPTSNLFDCGIVIVEGNKGASTPEQFGELDRIHGNFEDHDPKTDKLESIINAIGSCDIEKVGNNLYNIFQDSDKCDLSPIRKLKELGAYGALLSGSGSSIFGIYESFEKAESVSIFLNNIGYKSHACYPTSSAL